MREILNRKVFTGISGDTRVTLFTQTLQRDNERPFLTPDQMNQLIAAAKRTGCHPLRDSTALLVMYRHGLQVREAAWLEWKDVDFTSKQLYVRRCRLSGSEKVGASNLSLDDDEVTALKQLQEENPGTIGIFTRSGKEQLTPSRVRDIMLRAAEEAGLSFSFPLCPYMLWHSTGFYLASKGFNTKEIEDYLGEL